MPVPDAFAFIVAALAAVAAMPAVAEQMHGYHCSRDHDSNPVFRKPLHAATPSVATFGW